MVSIWPVLFLLIGRAAAFSPNAHAKGHALKPSSVCSGLRVTPPSDRTWLPLYHRRGPCSPSGIRTSNLADILRRDQLRVDLVGRKLSKNKNKNGSSADVTLGTSLGTLQYVVSVGLGTTAVRQTVLIDTGSDLSWVQCRPCPVPPCHRQKDAVFDPTKSSTYSSVRCGSRACTLLGHLYNGCSNSKCGYKVKYGDASNTTGTYSYDTLTMASSSPLLNSFLFGCSHAETGFDDSDRTDGLLGLGRSAQSLVSQTGDKAFSYCLPPTASHTGFFTLGVPRVSSSRFAVTPMYRFSKAPTFHVVILTAITVAGRQLSVPPSVFSNGSVMDSGTIVTRLPPMAYRALRAAFRAEMKMYPPAPPTSDLLDTCFNISGAVKLPSVGLVFERGATVELDPSGIMLDDCLAFAPTDVDEASIIGNVQQRTFEVLYDLGGQAVGFRRGAC